jgi:hypothetical protein
MSLAAPTLAAPTLGALDRHEQLEEALERIGRFVEHCRGAR